MRRKTVLALASLSSYPYPRFAFMSTNSPLLRKHQHQHHQQQQQIEPETVNKCLIYGQNNKVQTLLKPIPTRIPANHVLVRVHAAGLNPVDAKKVIGDKLPSALNFLSHRVVQGSVIGFEFSGKIVCTSSSSSSSSSSFPSPKYKPGDAVFGTMPPFGGTLSEYIVVPMDQISHIHDANTLDQDSIRPQSTTTTDHSTTTFTPPCRFIEMAAISLVGLTALQALRPYAPTTIQQQEEEQQHQQELNQANKTPAIVIVGASGGTGHVAIQVAKALGWKEIIAVCSTDNIKFCQDLGATQVVDYTTSGKQSSSSCSATLEPHNETDDTQQQDWWSQCFSEYEIHVVLDCVTSADERDYKHQYPQKLLPLCKQKYIRLGGKTLDWFWAGCERLLPVTCFRGKEKLFWIRLPQSSQDLQLLAKWVTEGKLKPKIAREVDFCPEAVQEALDELLSRRVKGKLVVRLVQEEHE